MKKAETTTLMNKVFIALFVGFVLLPMGIKSWSFLECLRHYGDGVASEHPVRI